MKTIACVAEPYLGYLAHLLSVGQVGFANNYGVRYRQTVRHADLGWLQRNAGLIAWGEGATGALTFPVVFLAGYLAPSTIPEVLTLLALYAQTARTGDTGLLRHRYPSLKRLDDWLTGPPEDPYDFKHFGPHADELLQLGDIMHRNHATYLEEVLPIEEARVAERVDRTNDQLATTDLIGRWETLTGYEFRYPTYTFVLSAGMRDGPSYNSLGYERNWADCDAENLFAGIVHEVGTHLLVDALRRVRDVADRRLVYDAYETLCDYYTEKILPPGCRRLIPGSRLYNSQVRTEIERVIEKGEESTAAGILWCVLQRLGK